MTKTRKVMPLAEWPAIDQECWNEALAGGEDGEGPAAEWVPETRDKVCRAWGRHLQWAADNGDLRPGLHPGDRMTCPAVRAFTAALEEDLAPHSVGMILAALCDAARVMAPEGDWAWVRRISRRVTRHALSVRDPATAGVDPALIYRLGVRIMQDAAAGSPARYGVGLILALLALVPALRSRAMRSLRIDDLAFVAGCYRLTIRAKTKKVKRQTHVVPLTPEITPFVDRWLHVHRLALVDASKPTDTLMLTATGAPYSRAKLWKMVANSTDDSIGIRVGPQRMRHCAATAIAIRSPENVLDTRYVLDHASHRTSQENYNLAGSVEASRRVQTNMLAVIDADSIELASSVDRDDSGTDNPPLRIPRPRRASGPSTWRRRNA